MPSLRRQANKNSIFQVARRYEELLFSGDNLPFDQFEKNMMGRAGNHPSDSDLSKSSSRPSSAKPKGNKLMIPAGSDAIKHLFILKLVSINLRLVQSNLLSLSLSSERTNL